MISKKSTLKACIIEGLIDRVMQEPLQQQPLKALVNTGK